MQWKILTGDHLTPEAVRKMEKTPENGFFRESCEKGFVQVADLLPEMHFQAPAAAFSTFDSPQEQTLWFGITGDWFFQVFVNRKCVCDCLKYGNCSETVFGNSHSCRMKKGKNLIAVYLQAGTGGSSFTFRFLPPPVGGTLSGATEEMRNHFFPPETALRCDPWIVNAGHNSADLMILTKSPAAAVLKYRLKGRRVYTELHDAAYGQFRICELHRFCLKDLKPGKTYEYQVELRRIKDSAAKVCGPFTFRTLPEKAHAFTFLADTQWDAERVISLLEKNGRAGYFKDTDLVIHLGDARNGYRAIPNDYPDVIIAPIQKSLTPDTLKLLQIRGNHSYRGSAGAELWKYLNEPYGMMRAGEVCYLYLDGGWDKDATPGNRWMDASDSYIEEEKRWLTETLKSPEWRRAKYHVVLAHETPCYDFSPDTTKVIRMLIEGVFTGESPKEKIDLWLCGHTHAAARFNPDSQKYLHPEKFRCYLKLDRKAGFMVKSKTLQDHYIAVPFEKVPFPFVVMGGPSPKTDCTVIRFQADKKGLHVKHYDAENVLFDDFSILPDKTLKVHFTKLREF